MTEPPVTIEAARALQMIRQGAVAEGIERYIDVLDRNRHSLPCGLHLRMLEGAGCDASALRARVLCSGGDLLVASDTATPEAVLDQYLALFSDGAINANMIARYLKVASGLGRHDEVAALTSSELIARRSLAPPDGSSRPDWLAALTTALLGAEDRTEWREERQSVRKMHFVNEPEAIDDAALQGLFAQFRTEVARYVAGREPGAHPVLQWIPQSFTIHPWAVISRGEGHNVRHTHHRGWLSGVFYVAWTHEPDDDGGRLHIGRPSDVPDGTPGWPDIALPPEPGTLVLMPSYFTHWTVPLNRPGLRLAVAFDVIDNREGSVPLAARH
jgi:hypothetical protein